MPSNRRFTDDEAAAILSRAIRAKASDQSQASAAGGENGFSLEELQKIGSEVGLSGEEILHASRTVMAEGPKKRFYLSGTPGSATREVILNANVDEDLFDELTPILRARFGDGGSPVTDADSYAWSSKMDIARTNVTVKSRKGKTRVTLTKDYNTGATMAYFCAGSFSVITASLTYKALAGTGWIAFCAVLSVFLVAFAVARGIVTSYHKKDRKNLDEAIRELEATVLDHDRPQGLEARLGQAEEIVATQPVTG